MTNLTPPKWYDKNGELNTLEEFHYNKSKNAVVLGNSPETVSTEATVVGGSAEAKTQGTAIGARSKAL